MITITFGNVLGSYEQSPRFMEAYGDALEGDIVPIGNGENQLREDLAEAMLETSTASHRAPGMLFLFDVINWYYEYKFE